MIKFYAQLGSINNINVKIIIIKRAFQFFNTFTKRALIVHMKLAIELEYLTP